MSKPLVSEAEKRANGLRAGNSKARYRMLSIRPSAFQERKLREMERLKWRNGDNRSFFVKRAIDSLIAEYEREKAQALN